MSANLSEAASAWDNALTKSAPHKYIRREGGPGNYRYFYADGSSSRGPGGKAEKKETNGGEAFLSPEQVKLAFDGELKGYNLQVVAGPDGKVTRKDLARAKEIKEKLAAGIGKSADVCQMQPPVCSGNLGVPRSSMPQVMDKTVKELLASDDPDDRTKGKAAVEAGADPNGQSVMDQLLDDLKKEGTDVKPGQIAVGKLKATQREIKAKKTYKFAEGYLKGEWNPGKKPIVISSDNHILDGHHRYSSLLAANPDAKMNVIRVDMPMKDFLDRSFKQPGVFRADLQDKIVPKDTPLDLPYKKASKETKAKLKGEAKKSDTVTEFDALTKAGPHKYKSRRRGPNGKWVYTYDEPKGQAVKPRKRPGEGTGSQGQAHTSLEARHLAQTYTAFLGSRSNFDYWGDPKTGRVLSVGAAGGTSTTHYGDKHHWRRNRASTDGLTEVGKTWGTTDANGIYRSEDSMNTVDPLAILKGGHTRFQPEAPATTLVKAEGDNHAARDLLLHIDHAEEHQHGLVVKALGFTDEIDPEQATRLFKALADTASVSYRRRFGAKHHGTALHAFDDATRMLVAKSLTARLMDVTQPDPRTPVEIAKSASTRPQTFRMGSVTYHEAPIAHTPQTLRRKGLVRKAEPPVFDRGDDPFLDPADLPRYHDGTLRDPRTNLKPPQ